MAVSVAVTDSFKTNPMFIVGATDAEAKRRVDICEKGIRIMRSDLGWSAARVCDHIGEYLRCELDGIDWAPSQRNSWLVGGRGDSWLVGGGGDGR